jgi:5-methylcytosine-specific restriction endonuclease McrA
MCEVCGGIREGERKQYRPKCLKCAQHDPERNRKVSEGNKKSHGDPEFHRRFVEIRRECAKKFSGEHHYLWNPNKTLEERIDRRRIPGYLEWRRSVYERDNYTCQICGRRGGRLAAHHVFNYADHKELGLVVDNGVTMCGEKGGCHRQFHKAYGKRNTTREQLEEFREMKRQQLASAA